MANRIPKLGGTTALSAGDEIKSADHNDSWEAIINYAGVGLAQNAYQTLQANNIFENKDFLIADEFVTASGTNGTVNTISTSATYDTDRYFLTTGPDQAPGDTTHNPNSFTNPENAFDGDDNTAATKTINSGSLGKTFSPKPIGYVRVVYSHGTHSGSPATSYLEWYNGSTWNILQTLSTTSSSLSKTTFVISANLQSAQGIRFRISSANSGSVNLYSLEYGGYNTSETVVCDTNTKTLDGTENSIIVYADKETPIDTDITVDIISQFGVGTGDGTNDVTSNIMQENDSSGTLFQNNKSGIKIKANEDLIVKSFNIFSGLTTPPSNAYITDTSLNILDTATISSNTATFSGNIVIPSGTEVYLLVDNSTGGANYDRAYDAYNSGVNQFTFPISGTYFDITGGYENASPNDFVISHITSVTTQTFQSSTTLTNQRLNEVIDISSLPSGNLSIKFNLKTTDTSVTPSIKGYGVYIK
jgi:hypothetical protein